MGSKAVLVDKGTRILPHSSPALSVRPGSSLAITAGRQAGKWRVAHGQRSRGCGGGARCAS